MNVVTFLALSEIRSQAIARLAKRVSREHRGNCLICQRLKPQLRVLDVLTGLKKVAEVVEVDDVLLLLVVVLIVRAV